MLTRVDLDIFFLFFYLILSFNIYGLGIELDCLSLFKK